MRWRGNKVWAGMTIYPVSKVRRNGRSDLLEMYGRRISASIAAPTGAESGPPMADGHALEFGVGTYRGRGVGGLLNNPCRFFGQNPK